MDTQAKDQHIVCPVCTLFLRPGISLGTHLESHPASMVIEALVKISTSQQQAGWQPRPNDAEQQPSPPPSQPQQHSIIYQHFMAAPPNLHAAPQNTIINIGQQYVECPSMFNGTTTTQMICATPYMYQQQHVILSGSQMTQLPRLLPASPSSNRPQLTEIDSDNEGGIVSDEANTEAAGIDTNFKSASIDDVVDPLYEESNVASPPLIKQDEEICITATQIEELAPNCDYNPPLSPCSSTNSEMIRVRTDLSKHEDEEEIHQEKVVATEYQNDPLEDFIHNPAMIAPVVNFDYERYTKSPILMNIGGMCSSDLFHREGGDDDLSVDSANIRADEHMPARGELSGQESNASDWSRVNYSNQAECSTSYGQRNVAEESEGSDIDTPSAADDAYNDIPTVSGYSDPPIQYKCPQCDENFRCPKERRVHLSEKHTKKATSSKLNVVGSRLSEKKVKKLVVRPKETEIKTETGNFDNVFTNRLKTEINETTEQTPPTNLLAQESKVKSTAICIYCDAVLSNNYELKRHRAVRHNLAGKSRYKCQTCDDYFQSENQFLEHLKIHPLQCRLCSRSFSRPQNMEVHMKRHYGIRQHKCIICEKGFITRQKLNEHTLIHTGEMPIKCTMCDKKFRRYSNFIQHRNRAHLKIKKKVREYVCFCGEVCISLKRFAWHKETHEEKPKSCTQCNAKFVHTASLTRHMRRAHNDRYMPDAKAMDENVECPVCKCILMRNSLETHLRNHSGVRPFTCEVCNKGFTTNWNLKLHKWTHATRSSKPFKCEMCKSAFIRENDYVSHMNSHKSVKPFTCNYCGKQFVRKTNCIRHVREHEKDKGYTCKICGKQFHRSYYLTDHMRVHNGERPFTCHICGKTSTTKSNHNKHVKIHHARDPITSEN